MEELEYGDVVGVAVALEVAGLRQRFYSHIPPVGPVVGEYMADTDILMEDLPHLLPEGGVYAWQMDLVGGTVDYEAIELHLATEGNEGLNDDPGQLFGAMGEWAAGFRVPILASIEPTSDDDIVVLQPPPLTWTYPRIIHLDGEAIYTTGFDGDGTEEDPYRFTGIVRGVGNTRAQRHVVEPLLPVPEITEFVAAWRGRFARILVAPLVDGAAVGPWRELMLGYLAEEAEEAGTVLTLRIMPLTTIMDVELGRAEENTPIRLLQGWHLFQPPFGCIVEHAQQVDIRSPAPAEYLNVFEITLVKASVVPLDGGEQALAWPLDGVLAINQGWAVDDAPPPMQLRMSLDGDGAAQLVGTRVDDEVFRTGIWLWSDPDALPDFPMRLQTTDAEFVSPTEHLLNYGIDFAHPTSGTFPTPHLATVLARNDMGGTARQDAWVRGPDVGWQWSQGEQFRIKLRGVAKAYRAFGEPKFLVERAVAVPDGGFASLAVSYFERAFNRQEEVVLRITACDELLMPDGVTVGYALTIHPDDLASAPSFGDWEGLPVVEITPTIVFRDAPAHEVMLELIESGTGAAVNGEYDRHPHGGNLKEEWLDPDSFAAHTPPEGIATYNARVPQGEKLGTIVNGMLQASRTAIVMRTGDDGRCRMTRIAIGPASLAQAKGDVYEDDFVVDADARNGRDSRIYNRVEFQLTLQTGGEKPVEIRDNRGIQRAAGETQTLKLDLRAASPWPEVDGLGFAVNVLKPLAGKVFFEFGRPRRLWLGDVALGSLAFAEPGAVYRFWHSKLKGKDGTYGVEGAPARIIAASFGLFEASGSIKASHHGARIDGWNASMQVVGQSSSSILRVAKQEFSPVRDAASRTRTDSSWFAAGNKVFVEPAGDHDAVDPDDPWEIVSITEGDDWDEVLLDAAHGLSGPHWGVVIPARYDDASPEHRELGWLAGSNERLGADDDEGTTLS